MIESRWKCRLDSRPDMDRLVELGHVSKAALMLGDYLTRIKGWDIQMELTIPNILPGKQPYRGDFFIIQKNLIIELDGKFHSPSGRAQEAKKDQQIRDMGLDVIRIPFIIPSHLVYGHLKDPEHNRVKQQYLSWFYRSFCPQVALAVLRWESDVLK